MSNTLRRSLETLFCEAHRRPERECRMDAQRRGCRAASNLRGESDPRSVGSAFFSSLKAARQFLIHSPHRHFSLCGVRRQLLVLLEFHRGDSLIFGGPSRNLILDRVSCVDK